MTQQINLCDASLRKVREWLCLDAALGAVALCIAIAAGGALQARQVLGRLQGPAGDSSAMLERRQAALRELAAQVSEQRRDAALERQIAQTRATLERHQAALTLLGEGAGGLGHDAGPASALQAIARQSIDGVWLTGLVLHGGELALRGRTLSAELVPAYVGRLNRETALQGRSFQALDIHRPEVEAAATPPYLDFSLSGVSNAAEGRGGPP